MASKNPTQRHKGTYLAHSPNDMIVTSSNGPLVTLRSLPQTSSLILFHYVSSCYILLYPVISCSLLLCPVVSCYILLRCVTSCYILLNPVVSCYPCCIVQHPATFYPEMVVSCYIRSCPAMSCHDYILLFGIV